MKSHPRHRQGFTLVELLIVITVLTILSAMAIPSIVGNREAADEASAANSLRMIDQAEASYRVWYGVYGPLSALSACSLVDPALGAASSVSTARTGYYFELHLPSDSQFFIIARPVIEAGTQNLYSDESGVLYHSPTTVPPPTTDASGAAPPGFVEVGQ